MRREGQGRHLALERAGALERGADHRAVAAMHAVEIADRQHGALQRPDIERLRAVARDMERFRGLIRLCSCGGRAVAGDIGHNWTHLGLGNLTDTPTVTAPLTKFQINRLFKRHC